MPLIGYDTPGVVRGPDMPCGIVIAGCSDMRGEVFVRYISKLLDCLSHLDHFKFAEKLDIPSL